MIKGPRWIQPEMPTRNASKLITDLESVAQQATVLFKGPRTCARRSGAARVITRLCLREEGSLVTVVTQDSALAESERSQPSAERIDRNATKGARA